MDLPLQFAEAEMLSPAKYEIWKLAAASLDPRCYRLLFGPGFQLGPFDHPVGVVNTLVVTSIPVGSTAWDFHRPIDYRAAHILAPGEVIIPSPFPAGFVSSYVYYFDPALGPAMVDPEETYYRRLNIINNIQPTVLELTVPSGAPPVQPSIGLDWSAEPTADYAILTKTSLTDGSWLTMVGFMEDDVTVFVVNTNWEISDTHSIRIGGSNIVPFTRKRVGVTGASAFKMSWGNKLGQYLFGPDVAGDPLLPVFNQLGAGGALPAGNIANASDVAANTTQANFAVIQYKPLSPAVMATY